MDDVPRTSRCCEWDKETWSTVKLWELKEQTILVAIVTEVDTAFKLAEARDKHSFLDGGI